MRLILLSLSLLWGSSVWAESSGDYCGTCTPEVEGTITSREMPILTAMAQFRDHTGTASGAQENPIPPKIQRGLCSAYQNNNFVKMQKMLRGWSSKKLGREMSVEEAYLHIRCDMPFAQNVDLMRVTAENPVGSREAAQSLVNYFSAKIKDKARWGKIVMCKREFGHGCLTLFDHIAKERTESEGNTSRVEALDDLKKLLGNHLGSEHLKHDPKFCRDFLEEPSSCQQ